MYYDLVVNFLIVCVGTFLHLNQLSLIGANDPTGVELVPNAASTLLTIVLLSALTKWRLIRGPARHMSLGEFTLRSLAELSVIICSVELLLIWIWVPMLVVLSGVCDWAAEDYLETRLAEWMNDCFFVLRFLLAASLGGTIAIFQGWFRTNKPNSSSTRHQQMNARLRARLTRRFGRNGQVYGRLITMRPGGVFSRIRDRRFAIRGVTLDDSSA